MNAPVAIGSTIAGKYRVERVLGQGGMGVVVVAYHDELDQRVAIKFLLRDAAADSEIVARFSREAKAAARIRSEHAVKVYDVGKLDTGAPYMVMEYLDGRDLQSILNERKTLPVEEAVEYLLQACEAIAEAHAAGVVHRDLKPANLFVANRADGSTCVKILDFGISKMTSLTGGDQQTVTNTAAIVGSPLYMSPEQMRASKNVDRRTDIWSLGVILQELVSGLPSFVANTTAELCALVLTAPPSPLGVIGAPRGLEDVIAKCLRKNAEERFATIAELARALEPFGPPSVKVSVERIVRLSGATSGSRPVAISIAESSGPISIVPAGQRAEDVASLGQTELTSAPTEPTGIAAPTVGAGTAATWATQAQPRRSRTPLIVVGSALAALGVLAIVFFVAARDRATPASPSADPATPTTAQTATSAAGTVATAVVPVATASVSASATASASATSAPAVAPTHAYVPRAPTTASAKKTAPVDTTGFGGRN